MSNPLSLIMKVVEYGKSPPKGPSASTAASDQLPPAAFKVPEISVQGSGKAGKLSREASFNWDFDDSPNGVDTAPAGGANVTASSGVPMNR